MLHLISPCPICGVQISTYVEYCKRCGCHLLLLSKIRYEADLLKNQNKIKQSMALYKKAANEVD